MEDRLAKTEDILNEIVIELKLTAHLTQQNATTLAKVLESDGANKTKMYQELEAIRLDMNSCNIKYEALAKEVQAGRRLVWRIVSVIGTANVAILVYMIKSNLGG